MRVTFRAATHFGPMGVCGVRTDPTHALAPGDPDTLASFVEKTVLFRLNCTGKLVRNYLTMNATYITF